MFSKAIPDRLLPHVITVVTPATKTDRYGNEVNDWTTAERADVRAWMEQAVASENTDDRNMQASTWRLIGPADLPLSGSARVEYRGETFEVIGPPNVVHGMRGPHHTEAVLRWVVG